MGTSYNHQHLTSSYGASHPYHKNSISSVSGIQPKNLNIMNENNDKENKQKLSNKSQVTNGAHQQQN